MFLNFLKLPLEKKKIEEARLEGGTILVVEDDDAIRDSLCGMLGDEGYHVKSAGNGLEAIGKLLNDSLQPDLIFLDVQMPYMDGPDFLAAIENQPAWEDIPVVLFTAGQRDCASKMLVSKLRKPVEVEEVLYLAKRYASHESSPGLALPLSS